MSEYKIVDKVHYFNYVKSILNKKNINIFNCNYDELRNFCDRLYNFSKIYEEKIRSNELKTPMHAFTYLLHKYAINEMEVFQIKKATETLLVGYEELVKEEVVEKEKYRRLYELFFLPSPEKLAAQEEQNAVFKINKKIEQLRISFEDRSNYLISRGLKYSEEFTTEAEKVIGESGIYIFYGTDKKTVFYVGKSASSLGERMATSSRERKGIFYFSYALTKNANEASIYEMYYISKLKPILNVDGNYGGEIDIDLPNLDFVEIKPLYKEIEANGEVLKKVLE